MATPGIIQGLKGRTVVRASGGFEEAWWRARLLIFSVSGHDQESAAALLTTDMSNLRWPGGGDAESWGETESGGGDAAEERRRFELLEAGVRLSDSLEDAVRVGDADGAYRAVSEASAKMAQGTRRGHWEGHGGSLAAAAYARVMWVGAGLMERDRRYADALELLVQMVQDDPPPLRTAVWRGRIATRRIQDMVHLGRLDAACDMCEQVLSSDALLAEGEHREEIKNRLVRLAVPPRRWVSPKFAPPKAALKRLVEGSGGGGVEAMAMEWYAVDAGWEGVGGGGHVENGFWHQVFGLLFADLVLEGAGGRGDGWLTRYMDAPLEWGTSGLWAKDRVPKLEERLSLILSGEGEEWKGMLETLRTNWVRYDGVPLVGVDWGRHGHGCDKMCEAVRCFGGRVVEAVCRRFARDYQLWSHGLPDLLMIKPSESKGKLVEVSKFMH